MNAKLGLIFLFCFSKMVLGQDWEPNFDLALSKSSQEGKPLILVFSGSDWCAPCIKLDKEIWQSNDFIDHASKNYVLYKADFPRKKVNRLSDELSAKNKDLAERFNPEGFFPLVVLLGENLTVLGTTGYKKSTPKAYIDLLDSFLE